MTSLSALRNEGLSGNKICETWKIGVVPNLSRLSLDVLTYRVVKRNLSIVKIVFGVSSTLNFVVLISSGCVLMCDSLCISAPNNGPHVCDNVAHVPSQAKHTLINRSRIPHLVGAERNMYKTFHLLCDLQRLQALESSKKASWQRPKVVR